MSEKPTNAFAREDDPARGRLTMRIIREYDVAADLLIRVGDRVRDGRHLMQPRHTDPRFCEDVLS